MKLVSYVFLPSGPSKFSKYLNKKCPYCITRYEIDFDQQIWQDRPLLYLMEVRLAQTGRKRK
jgi:hypothetical protein